MIRSVRPLGSRQAALCRRTVLRRLLGLGAVAAGIKAAWADDQALDQLIGEVNRGGFGQDFDQASRTVHMPKATIPIAISQYANGKMAPPQAQVAKPRTPDPQPAKPQTNLGAALAGLAVLGLASPLLELQDPFHGMIGLVILLVGIRIAWRLTAGVKLDILGPFDKNTPAPAPPPIAG